MKYQMDRSGIGRMMRSHPGIQRQLFQAGNKTLAVARSRINNKSGNLSASGSVEDAGIQPVFRGEPRMTVRVVFRARHAMAHEKKTGFLSAAMGKGRPRR